MVNQRPSSSQTIGADAAQAAKHLNVPTQPPKTAKPSLPTVKSIEPPADAAIDAADVNLPVNVAQPPAVVTTAVKTVQGIKAATFDGAILEIKENGTVAEKSLCNVLETYIERMAPLKPISPEEGARAQYSLWKALSTLLENGPDNEFKKLWELILKYFDNYKDGVFGDRYIYRFSQNWTWAKTENEAYIRLLNLIKVSANPITRSMALRQVNLDATMQVGFSEMAKNRLISFYAA